MKSISIFILFLGLILIIKGYYSKKYSIINEPKIIIKYIPRSEYEAQLSDKETLNQYYKNMFNSTQLNQYDINNNNKKNSNNK